MSTSPGADPYGSQHQPPSHPYRFPSAPTPEPEQPYRQPRIQPYAPPQAPPPQTARGGGLPGGPGAGGSGNVPGNGGGNGGTGRRRSQSPSGLVRPYTMTGGRTRPRYQLAIEALVSTTADPERLRGQLPEHQRICLLCREIKSVAEISALLTIPLGVVRILVADLAEAGLVAIHQPGGDESAGGQPDVTLLERVLSGLRKL
ncbi:DUF742 domain-containing protein [Actinacidiphila acididurans]|uniref:DUF742 domain-containing protein n=1 Tax=Actinacidiphila acididurans TaxID=2784346 RepID=A0ABS2TKM0_9ACTN|nr:DUF742 domain-containing protein [Actinacidiphila acididurans]MBM9503867.1 DUF742 domain-containing protein [Actinacidiphila acididurans]